MSSPKVYHYLERRPEKRTKHLCVKGRNLTVGGLIGHMRTNALSPEQLSEDTDLPIEAIFEALQYFEENEESILAENEAVGRELGLVRDDAPEPVPRR